MITLTELQKEWKTEDDIYRNLVMKKENINDITKLLPDFTRMAATSYIHIIDGENVIVSYQLLEIGDLKAEDKSRRFDMYPFSYNPDTKSKINVGFSYMITKIKSDVTAYPEFVM